MLNAIGKYVAKNAGYMALDMLVPGLGYTVKKANQLMNVANLLGPKATPERVECIADFMEDAGEAAKETAMDFLDSLF